MNHVGALPYFTEVCGYNGPIYMLCPTKALSPLMLEDYGRVMVDRRGEEELFTSDHIANCMKKAIETGFRHGKWLHGEAVATDMVMAVDMSHGLGWIDDSIVVNPIVLLKECMIVSMFN